MVKPCTNSAVVNGNRAIVVIPDVLNASIL